MTEKEKMERGEWHDANFDEELLAKRARAEELCYDFNMGKPGSNAQLDALKTLLDTDLPAGLTILSPAYFDYGDKTTFGDGCFVNHGCYFMDGGSITFGDNVFIGPFCGFYTASHPLGAKERNLGLERALPIVVGDNCWFGANVSVLQGVTIGSGCVISAGSVVTEDLPDNVVAAGVPAVVKKVIEQ
ncbi:MULTISPECIES: sugar O-acetyltransferase [unclassified Collinsella]|uniref:sugar O-acetyltransferase n=1 Tax=unclassified Collinsella TaxID=2637548 RepID=UPI0018F16190|nr:MULTISPECIES: sugar O-acetyltransferase [unclassified Collinsella]